MTRGGNYGQQSSDKNPGDEMYSLCERLFPICRSITGNGFRQSLEILRETLPEMTVHEVPTGTSCFDWEIPKEWNIYDAYIVGPDGQKHCEFANSNLHVVGYSIPVNKTLELEDLQKHLYSLPEQPEAIPYVTSYYKEGWGFCISERERQQLKSGTYQVVIDSELKAGSLTYGEILLPGSVEKEIFLSTYLCHPSMANNELSGPVVTTFLANWIRSMPERKYSYRIIIIPETIGSIAYLSKNLAEMKEKMIAGFNVTCVGDDRTYSYLASPRGDTLSDQVAKHVLNYLYPGYKRYSFLERGSDERQYCSPLADLPVCSIMRSKFGCYPEYHTSLDNLELVSPQGLLGGYRALQHAVRSVECSETFIAQVPCEPQLGRRGLYPVVSTKNSSHQAKTMTDFLAYCNGSLSTLDIAEIIGVPVWELKETIDALLESNLILKAY